MKAALVCEFCKAVLNRPPPRAASPAPAPAPASGWSTPIVCGVALLSAGLGFGARGFFVPAPKPDAVVAAPPPAPVAKKPEPAPVAVLDVPPAPPKKEPVVEVEPEPVRAPQPEPEQPQQQQLKRFRIPYEHLEGLAQRIIIPVTLNGRHTVKMALDTGAPGTILSAQLASRLGILRDGDARLITMAGGIGGTTAASLIILDSIAVGEASTEFVPATVTSGSLSDAWEGLVGMDFLAGYTLQVDTLQHVLVLTEQPPNANAPAGHDEAWWRRNFSLLAGERTKWKTLRSTLEERVAKSEISAGGDAESLKKLVVFAQQQDREAEALASRLDRYASTHSVPLEWRKQ